MTTPLEESLSAVLEDRLLLSHPFYRRWEAGELSQDELKGYAEQYRYFEAMLPTFLDRLGEQLPEGTARDSVLANLHDEVSPPSHLQLFDQFSKFYGAEDSSMSPAMEHLVGSYSELLQTDTTQALAGLWAYETQGAGIAETKALGLTAHYGASDDAVEFWAAHVSAENDHARWTLDALETLEPDVIETASAARRIANAWWSFLDEREMAVQ